MAIKKVKGRYYLPTEEEGFSPEQIKRFRTEFEARKQRPSDEVAISRLLGVYEHATPHEIDEGMYWYGAAHDLCAQMKLDFPRVVSLEHAAGIVAALSPTTGWDENIAAAIEMILTTQTRSRGTTVADARAILRGEHPADVLFAVGAGQRGNLKVQSFYTNITKPQLDGVVTVDRHAIAACYDDRKIVSVMPSINKSTYEWAQDMYVKAAQSVGVIACQFQAIVWVAWRKNDLTERHNPHPQLDLFGEPALVG